MPTVRIEHKIPDFDAWKAAFDSDPADRRGAGVRAYRIMRPLDDPAYVMIDLDFDTRAAADAFIGVMQGIWESPQAARALAGHPHARVIETVEQQTL